MICRLCLCNLNETNAYYLYCNGEESEMVKIIAKYFFLEITACDSISTNVCQKCAGHLNTFHNFCKYVHEKQSSLQNEFLDLKCKFDMQEESMLPNTNASNDESLLNIKDVLIECETKLGALSEEEFGCAHNMESDDNNSNHEYNHSLKKPTEKRKRTTLKHRTSFMNSRKSNLKRRNSTKRLTESTVDTLAKNTENTPNLFSSTLNKSKVAKNSETENEIASDELISNYLQLKCDLCETSLESFAKLLAHFKKTHNCKGYIKCCGRSFQKRIKLIEHINMHINPQCFQCKVCNKNLKTKYSLDLHIKNKHTRKEDLKYKCTVCEKRFANNNNLKIHMLAHQTERAYACTVCEKAFVTQYRLNSHMKTMHSDTTPHVCDYCGRKFKFKPSFDLHIAEHQGISREPPVQCNICGEWYKHKYGLNKHIKRHNAVQVECEQCGRICRTKEALESHIRYTHNKQSNLQCSFCEKTFKLRLNLEEHIAMHTGEKHNACPHCPKEFRSKANMYVHIKRDHFEEWSKKRSKAPTISKIS